MNIFKNFYPRISVKRPPNYKVLFSEEDSNIIVLRPDANKYLRWMLPTPHDLIKQKEIKAPVGAFTIFKLNCTAAILDSQGFIEDFSKRVITKTISDIWNNADENVKDEYKKLCRNLQKLQSIVSYIF
jgi:hypothetical protein